MTRIFISHSHSDEAIAFKLVNFLLAALRLEEEDILCTSNPDQGLSYSYSSITDQLKNQLKNSSALIILITADSLHSAWIPFEAGSFWTTDKPIIPILGPGLTQNDLPGPLRSCLSILIEAKNWEHKVNNAINQLVDQLKIQQKVTKRRNDTFKEFSNSLRAWQSKRPATDPLQQREIEELKNQIQDLEQSCSKQREEKEKLDQERAQLAQQLENKERLHQQELREREATYQKEKEELEQNYQNQKYQLEQSLQSQILISSLESRENKKPPLVIYAPDLDIKLVKGDDLLVKRDDLFFPELKFIEQEDALPGALSPQFNEPLIFNGQRITPLIPLKPLLLDYFTPEDLLSIIEFQTLKTREGLKIRLILDLPLTGVKENQQSENYRLYKDYALKEENSLGYQLPVLQIWPNFKKQDWKEYYIFYYDGELEDRTFKITYPQAKNIRNFKEGFGTFLMYRAADFPEYLICTDFTNNEIGLILFKSPAEIRANNCWQVGVDFGVSLTNIYINSNRHELPQPLDLKNLQLQVTDSITDTRLTTLFEYFVPENFKLLYDYNPLPIHNILTTRGKDLGNPKMLPILDSRIYVPDLATFKPQQNWIKTNLKWSTNNLPYIELFLKNLALHISALAAEGGVKEIQWAVSYPPIFSQEDIRDYASLWRDIIQELRKTTGIIHKIPEIDSKNFRLQNIAFAQYFADFEDRDLVCTTCIYMEDDISDISIWEDNNMVYQSSVYLAGQDIFSQFLKLNSIFAVEKFGFDPREWKGLGADAFSAKLDAWLRYDSQQWLAEHRVLQREDKDFQGLTRLMTIGIAGLYYYVGILLKVVSFEDKYKRSKITTVYIGGKDSRFFNWLDERGKFDRNSELNELFSRMLSKGSGFEDTKEITFLSCKPQAISSCGLVLNKKKLQGLSRRVKDPIITGETCFINGIEFTSDRRLTLSDNADEEITEFTIRELVEVPKFLYEFHQAIKDLELESITGLKDYYPSLEKDDNSKLWEDTKRELDNMLLDIKGDSKNISPESGFILGLRALLIVLDKQWAYK